MVHVVVGRYPYHCHWVLETLSLVKLMNLPPSVLTHWCRYQFVVDLAVCVGWAVSRHQVRIAPVGLMHCGWAIGLRVGQWIC